MIEKPIFRSVLRISLGLCLLIASFWIWTKGRDSSSGSQSPARVAEDARERSGGGESAMVPTAEPVAAEVVSAEAAEESEVLAEPAVRPAGEPVSAELLLDFLDRIVSGKSVSFTLPDGRQAGGGVQMMERDRQGVLFVQGRLTTPQPGFYFFQRQTVAGMAGPLVGNVRFDGEEDAWKIEPDATFRAARMVARKIDEIICASYAPKPEATEGDVEEAPETHPYPVPIPSNETIVPLQSLPGATAVIYLDFDGEQGPFPGWGDFDAAPANANNDQVFEVWKMVCEDFQGFTINVTTDRKVFDAAPEGRRAHCIISPTTNAAPGAGGVAYVGSFNWSGDRVCWAFYSTGKSSCEVISHEIGHTLGLSHDGRTSPSEGYYGGHGTDPVGWAPIMGVGYYKKLSQWSKGEYLSANQTQDDLSIITNNNNDVDYRTDDTGDVQATAKYLEILANNSVSSEGIIEKTGDVDSFRFATAGGSATLNVNTVAANPNLDILAEIVNAGTSTVVASNNPDTGINATMTATLAAGEYLLRIRGTGRGDPLGDGYTDYGSLGSYLITGSVTGGVKSERFSIAENSANGSAVGTVVPRNNHAGASLTYAIASGNTGGAFSINPATGALTVANSAILNYEALSLRWDDPATIELFVTITNASNPSLNENLRTVVTVLNSNETPTLTGGAVSMLEHTLTGTKVFKVSASDSDPFDFPTYSITAGNTGGVFTIHPNTGQITVAAYIDVAANTVYNLTVQVADQGAPALTATANVAVTVVNITNGYEPGKIVRTYFESISGGTVANLTGNAKFPNTPDSEQFLTSFDGVEHGDNFGSTIRGYLIPPSTGNYQFWIASDDASELRLSTNSNPASATARASVSGWTDPYAWTANSSQQSATISLTAGQPYYIEARHKEGGGGDHVAVAWSGPGFTRQIISGLFLAPYYQNYAPKVNAATFSVREDAIPGQAFGTATSSDVNAQDTFSAYTITAGNTGGVFGINASTGQLFVAAPGLLNGATTPTYSLTVRSTDNGTPSMNGTGTITVNVLPASTISTTNIVQEIWTGITGTALSGLTGNTNYPYKPNTRRTLTAFDSGTGYADNYGSRIRARFIPPTTGDYRFYLAGDDDCRLLYSSNASGSGATQIASITGWSDPNVWTKYTSQTSAVISLTAGQAVYLEALHKEGGGGDHVSVGYTNAEVTTTTVIPGSLLQPFDINAPPAFSPTTYAYTVNISTATNGMTVGTPNATEPNGETLVYAILSGNSAGAFAINGTTGTITVANTALLSNGVTTLQVAAQDGGLGGVYPLDTATATVNITVTGGNLPPTFTSNPFSKPNATEAVSYSQTLAGSATDPNAGDTLTYSKTSGPSWLAVAANGALTGTPGNFDGGANAFVVRVTDTSGAFAEATLNIQVIAVNFPPAFPVDPINTAAVVGFATSGNLTANDPDAADTLTYSKVSGPAWLSVSSAGVLSGSPAAGDLGNNSFVVRATDNWGLFDDAALNITVFSTPVWANASGGSWPVTSNWQGNIAASGADITANFATLNLTNNAAVTLDGARTIGHLSFADTTPSHAWTLNTGTAGPLTLNVASGAPTITVQNQSATVSAVLAGTKGLNKLGAGILTLDQTANTFSGNLTVSAGTLQTTTAQSAGTNSPLGVVSGSRSVTVSPGAVLHFQGNNVFGGSGKSTATLPSMVVQGTLSATRYNILGSLTLSNATLSQSSTDTGNYEGYQFLGTITVSGSGPSTISSGNGRANHLYNGTTVFSVADTTSSSAVDLLVSNPLRNASNDYSLGTGSLIKSGAGTMELTAANTYTGNTTVSAGTLLLNGSLANGIVTVGSAGTLGGTGIIGGSITSSGNLSPGSDAVGNLSTSGQATLQANSSVNWEIGDWNGAAGSGYDQLTVTGLSINATSANPVVIRIRQKDLTNFSETSRSFTLVDNNGALTGFDAQKFSLDVSGFTAGGGTWAIQSSGTDLILAYTRTNTAPAFAVNPLALAATEDAEFNGILSANDPDAAETLTYTKLTGPAWLTVGSNGNLSGTPLNADVGSNSFLIRVEDSFNSTSNLDLIISVTNTNDAPSFTANPILGAAATEDSAYSGTLAGSAVDPDIGDTLTYSKTSGPAWLEIAGDGTLTGTPGNGDVGTNEFSISVSDGFTTAAATLQIEVANTNDAPAFASNPILGADAAASSAYSGTVAGAATDPDAGDTLTYSKTSGPAWLTVGSNGALSGTPETGDAGPNIFTLRATDAGGLFAETSLHIQVTATSTDANNNGILDSWETEKFGNANSGANPPEGDPDGDGLSNLMEFALDTHPTHANASPLTHDLVVIGPDKHLRLTVPRNPLATNLSFVVETCGVLNDWSATNTVIETDTAGQLIVRDSIAVSAASRRFIRLKVQTQP